MQRPLHLIAELPDRPPLRFGVGPGDPWRFLDALDGVGKAEAGLAGIDRARDRGRAGRLRRRGQRDMALAGKQAGGRVQPHPARAGQEHLAPGVQIGKVLRGAGRPGEGLDIGLKLGQITGDKARREAKMTADLHHEQGAVTTGAGPGGERLLTALHARFHADQILDPPLQGLI